MNDVFAFSWLPYNHFIQSLLLQIHCLECSCLHRSEYYSRSENDFILYLYCHFACLICIFHCNEFVFELNMHQPLNGISVIGLFSKRQSFPWKGAFVCVSTLWYAFVFVCVCVMVKWSEYYKRKCNENEISVSWSHQNWKAAMMSEGIHSAQLLPHRIRFHNAFQLYIKSITFEWFVSFELNYYMRLDCINSINNEI